VSSSVNCAIESFLTSRCVVCGSALPEVTGAGRPRETCKGEGEKLSPCRTHLNNARRRIESRRKKLQGIVSEAFILVTEVEENPPVDWGHLPTQLGDLLQQILNTSIAQLLVMEVVREEFEVGK